MVLIHLAIQYNVRRHYLVELLHTYSLTRFAYDQSRSSV